MELIIVVIVLVLLFGGGGVYYGGGAYRSQGFGIGGILIVLLVLWMLFGHRV